MNNKSQNTFNSKTFRVGGYSVIATVILIVVVVLANVLVNAIPSRFTQYDVSKQKLYTLSEQSVKIASGADRDVTIYWIVQDGKEDAATENLINRYAGLSSHISIQKIDPDLQPTFVEKYKITYLYNNSLVVECGDLYRYVSYSEIYDRVYDYSSYNPDTEAYNYELVFDGEHVITSALNYVLYEKSSVIYRLTGHDEKEMPLEYNEAIEDENFDLKELSLLTTDGIPDDCAILLILCPQTDLTTAEVEMIQEYEAKGGDTIIVTEPLNTEHPNLAAMMEAHHVYEHTGVVMEADENYYASRYPQYCLVPKILDHDITAPLESKSLKAFMPMATGITVGAGVDDETISKLLRTSTKAYIKQNVSGTGTLEKEDGDVEDQYIVALIVEDPIEELDDEFGYIAWFTSNGIIDDSANAMSSGGNLNLFINTICYMCGQEDSISIHSKSLSTNSLNVTAMQSLVHSIIMVGVIPVLFLLAGTIIVIRRRRK